MNNPSCSIREVRADLTPYLFHYTSGAKPSDVLSSILHDHALKSEKGVICFTEAPLTACVEMFNYMDKFRKPMYVPYGIGISRDLLIKLGARNVIYGTDKEVKALPEDLQWRSLPIDPEKHDYSWLREWRLKGEIFDFEEYKKEIIIIAPSEDELTSFVANQSFEYDCSGYEPESGEVTQTMCCSSAMRNWKGISIEAVRGGLTDDYAVSGATINQIIGENMLKETHEEF